MARDKMENFTRQWNARRANARAAGRKFKMGRERSQTISDATWAIEDALEDLDFDKLVEWLLSVATDAVNLDDMKTNKGRKLQRDVLTVSFSYALENDVRGWFEKVSDSIARNALERVFQYADFERLAERMVDGFSGELEEAGILLDPISKHERKEMARAKAEAKAKASGKKVWTEPAVKLSRKSAPEAKPESTPVVVNEEMDRRIIAVMQATFQAVGPDMCNAAVEAGLDGVERESVIEAAVDYAHSYGKDAWAVQVLTTKLEPEQIETLGQQAFPFESYTL